VPIAPPPPQFPIPGLFRTLDSHSRIRHLTLIQRQISGADPDPAPDRHLHPGPALAGIVGGPAAPLHPGFSQVHGCRIGALAAATESARAGRRHVPWARALGRKRSATGKGRAFWRFAGSQAAGVRGRAALRYAGGSLVLYVARVPPASGVVITAILAWAPQGQGSQVNTLGARWRAGSSARSASFSASFRQVASSAPSECRVAGHRGAKAGHRAVCGAAA